MNKQDVERIINQIKENTKTYCVKIRTRLNRERLPLTCSKFGGIPYWPNNRADYPKTNTGIPLTLLAQINLSELPENDIFPTKGLLQFYVWNLEDWDNYKAIFHEDCDIPASPYLWTLPTSLMPEEVEITSESGENMTVPNLFWGESGMFPITGEMKLEFEKIYDFANPTENCFESEFKKAVKQLNINVPEDFDVYSNTDICNTLYEYSGGHKLLGRPCFVQYDYRETKDNSEDILLLQIDSAWKDTGETDRHNFIIFGDAGSCGFFIRPDDLKKLDFSNVYYDWACY